jgi:hypothetical protein
MFGNCMAHPTVMSRRSVLERVHYYRSEARYVEDYDLWLRAASVTNLVNIPKVLLRYRIVSDSLSSRNVLIQGQEAAKLRRFIVGELLNRPPADIQLESSGLWLDLYRIYQQRVPLSRADSSEITLDIFRRACLLGRLGNRWTQLLPYAPRLFSMRCLRKVLRFGLAYGANVRYGFTTQRRLSG